MVATRSFRGGLRHHLPALDAEHPTNRSSLP
jgi:hypothetical protein